MNHGPSNNLTLGFWNLMLNRNRNAQNLVGIGDCHFWGKGTVVDYVQAFNYYQEAKEINPKYIEVWDRLRLCYLKGMGDPNSQQLAKEAYDRWLALRNASMTHANRVKINAQQSSQNAQVSQASVTNTSVPAAVSSSTSQAQPTQYNLPNERKRKSDLQSLMDNLVINPASVSSNATVTTNEANMNGQTYLPKLNHTILVVRQIESNKKYLADLDQKIKAINEVNDKLMRELTQREKQFNDNSTPQSFTPKI